MNDALLVMLILIGLFALYWILFGQWHHNENLRRFSKLQSEPVTNKKMREYELARLKMEKKKK